MTMTTRTRTPTLSTSLIPTTSTTTTTTSTTGSTSTIPTAPMTSTTTTTTSTTGSLMAIGGHNGKHISSAEILSTSCDFPLPEARYGHISVTTADGNILVCGGKTPSGYTTSCLQFNFQSKTWEHHSNMENNYRYLASAIALKHGVYILGGYDSGARSSSEFLAT